MKTVWRLIRVNHVEDAAKADKTFYKKERINMWILVILALVGAIAGILYYLGVKVKNVLKQFGLMMPGYMYRILFVVLFVFVLYIRSGLIVFYEISLIGFAVCDIVFVVCRIFRIKGRIFSKIYFKGVTVLAVSFFVSIMWQYNAFHPVVKEYNVSLDKKIHGGLNAVFISDIHAGTAIKKWNLTRLTDTVNEINPDIILLGGDIFDESSSREDIENTCKAFGEMNSLYGIYYISGNHDADLYNHYISELEQAGVIVIDDEIVLVGDKFYIAGRRDEGMLNSTRIRMPVDELLDNTDKEYPIIMLDHRPEYFDEDTGNGIDLLLCGHTHNGQIFPGNLFIELFNNLAYGHEKYNGTDVIVSSGYGVWGYPVRSGSQSELVSIHIE